MNRTILSDTKNYSLITEYESTILLNKIDNKELHLRDHYGDPSCGNIDKNEQWCIVGGEGITVYFIDQKKSITLLAGLFIHSIRIKEHNKINIIVDPWSDESGTWELNIKNLSIKKISKEPDLRDEPYQESIMREIH